MFEKLRAFILEHNLFWLVAGAVVAIFTILGFGMETIMLILYKLSIAYIAALVGMAIDSAIFAYAQPRDYMTKGEKDGEVHLEVIASCEREFHFAQFRRTIIICVIILGVCLGL